MTSRWIMGCLVVCMALWALSVYRCCVGAEAACEASACADTHEQAPENASSDPAGHDCCDHASCAHSSLFLHVSFLNLAPPCGSYALLRTHDSAPDGATVTIERPPAA